MLTDPPAVTAATQPIAATGAIGYGGFGYGKKEESKEEEDKVVELEKHTKDMDWIWRCRNSSNNNNNNNNIQEDEMAHNEKVPNVPPPKSSQCVPRVLKFVPQVPILFPNMVPSIILSSHVLWLKLSFHCTQVPNVFLKVLKCVPQHGPKYHTFISCALSKVALSLYPKFPMCSPTWSKVS
jgi:hypothetical protein